VEAAREAKMEAAREAEMRVLERSEEQRPWQVAVEHQQWEGESQLEGES